MYDTMYGMTGYKTGEYGVILIELSMVMFQHDTTLLYLLYTDMIGR